MESLEINQKPFWYFLYDRTVPLIEDGEVTGEKIVKYKSGKETEATISPATGNSYVEIFGKSIQYDRVILINGIDSPITETTVLCVDKSPEYDIYGNPLYDYVVKRVAKSLNTTAIAIARVEL